MFSPSRLSRVGRSISPVAGEPVTGPAPSGSGGHWWEFRVGLTLGLLVAALLLGRSAVRIAAPAGFETRGVALLRVRPRLVGDHHRRGRLDGDIAAGVSCQSG